jgi:hypothetical protein
MSSLSQVFVVCSDLSNTSRPVALIADSFDRCQNGRLPRRPSLGNAGTARLFPDREIREVFRL